MRLVALVGLLCLECAAGCSAAPERAAQTAASHGPVRELLDEGRYVEATSAAEALLRSEGPGRGAASSMLPGSGSALDLLVEARWRNGEVSPETLAQAERAAAAHHYSSILDRARSLRNLGRTLLLAGRAANAVEALEAAVKTLEGEQHTDAVADALESLTLGLVELARYDDAEQGLKRALEARQAGGPDRPESVRALELLALVYLRSGRYEQARSPLERALAFRRKRPNHPETAMAHSLLGDLLWFEGRPSAARDAYAECVSISERSLRQDHPDTAHCTRRLGTTIARLGDAAEGLGLLDRAVSMAERSLGPEHPQFSGFLNDLAVAHVRLLDYRKARSLYERALAIRERHLGPDHQDLATLVFNLAAVSSNLGDLAEARRQFDRAIAIWSNRLGPEHPFVALGLRSLAQTLTQHGLNREALSLQRRVLAIREKNLGLTHPETAEALADIAGTLIATGRTAEAIAISERAIDIWERAETPDSISFAAALRSRADVLAAGGELPKALEFYTKALEITEEVFGADHSDSAELRVSLAAAALAEGRRDVSWDHALTAERAAQRFLQTTIRYLPEREALTYGARRPNGLNLILSVAIASPQDAAKTRTALDAVIGSRARVLDEMAARHPRVRELSDAGLSTFWASWTTARQKLANLAVRGAQERTGPGYRAALDEARREAELAERQLAEKGSDLKALLEPVAIGSAEVERGLPPSSSVISFVKFERTPLGSPVRARARRLSSYAAFVTTPGTAGPVLVPLGGSAAIETAIATWRREASSRIVRPDGSGPDDRYRVAGSRVRQLLWDPLIPHLRTAKRVFIVPDGAINLVSFASLPSGHASFLLDEGPTLHYVSTERDLVQRRAPAPAARGLLALGGPSFNVASRQREGAAVLRDGVTGCGAFRSMHFSPLTGTLQEVTEIAQRWNDVNGPGTPAGVMSGDEASEGVFKRRATGQRVLHLATHGFFLDGACHEAAPGTRSVGGLSSATPDSREGSAVLNPLLLSGLALAGANQRARAKGDEDDGILTAEEIAALNLEGTEWAVLSACDTGLGEIRAGEGVFGLRRAFQVAGVRTVIMSLWSVEDQATRQWMRALYEARLERGLDTADSVRAAALSVLNDRRAKGQSTHPFYWAAFVAAGDWR